MITFTKVHLPTGWLSNMSPHPVNDETHKYRTAEHLFQCMRFDDPVVRSLITAAVSPMQAKILAKKYAHLMVVEPRSPQDVENMWMVLQLKLIRNPHLITKLTDLQGEVIVEDVTKRQDESSLFWGAVPNPTCTGLIAGKNVLGTMWMRLREEILKLQYAHTYAPVGKFDGWKVVGPPPTAEQISKWEDEDEDK